MNGRLSQKWWNRRSGLLAGHRSAKRWVGAWHQGGAWSQTVAIKVCEGLITRLHASRRGTVELSHSVARLPVSHRRLSPVLSTWCRLRPQSSCCPLCVQRILLRSLSRCPTQQHSARLAFKWYASLLLPKPAFLLSLITCSVPAVGFSQLPLWFFSYPACFCLLLCSNTPQAQTSPT